MGGFLSKIKSNSKSKKASSQPTSKPTSEPVKDKPQTTETTKTMAPITMYSAVPLINGWKTAIVFEALGLPYETKYLDITKAEHKAPDYLKIQPNGQIPAIIDGDFTLWETGAIARYLTDKYDKDRKYSFDINTKERYLVEQWLDFHSTTQVPFWQKVYGLLYVQKETDKAVLKPAFDELVRHLQIFNKALEGKTYLVGEKCTIADLSYAPWLDILEFILPKTETEQWAEIGKLSNAHAWHQRLREQPACIKVAEIRKKFN